MDKIVRQADSGLTTAGIIESAGTIESLSEVQNTPRPSKDRVSFPFDKAFQFHFWLLND